MVEDSLKTFLNHSCNKTKFFNWINTYLHQFLFSKFYNLCSLSLQSIIDGFLLIFKSPNWKRLWWANRLILLLVKKQHRSTQSDIHFLLCLLLLCLKLFLATCEHLIAHTNANIQYSNKFRFLHFFKRRYYYYNGYSMHIY